MNANYIFLCGMVWAHFGEEDAGLELIYQDFEHPVYEQTNTPEFVPGLSVIDALMNCGFVKTGEMILNG